jgi:rare lipoprotein A (peptidoglycan hydrolase)
MKSMKIKLNGDLVEEVKTPYHNDLKNTFSPKNHKPTRPEIQRPFYKSLYYNQLSTNKGLLISNGITLFLALGIIVGCSIRVQGLKNDLGALESLRIEELIKTEAIIIRSNEIEAELASCSAKLPQPKTFKGKVSYYSSDGCLGCSPNQITASGEPFDENKYTMAIPVEWRHIPMKTTATVKNLDNGRTLTVRINDRGGFLKYNRVGDLSKAAYIALGAKTDVSNLEFTWY